MARNKQVHDVGKRLGRVDAFTAQGLEKVEPFGAQRVDNQPAVAAQKRVVVLKGGSSLLCDGRKGHGGAHVLRAATKAALLAAAHLLRHDRRARAHIERSARDGARDLVRSKRGGVNAQLRDIEGNVPERLNRIAMHKSALGMHKRYDTRDGLHGSNLVVCAHHTNEGHIGPEHMLKGLEVHDTVGKHRDALDHETITFK